MSTRRPWALITVVALLLVVTAYVAFQATRSGREATAKDEALEAARTRVPVLLTYDYRTLDQDLTRSKDQTVGRFGRDYAEVLDDAVANAATTKKIATKATLNGAGVVRGDDKNVTVLVFLTQTTTAPGVAPSISTNRVEVEMRRTAGAWKIAGLTPR